MLEALFIRNIVLIDQLELKFGKGLSVLTGETGAGKSILLDSLALALGGRADQRLVRAGADQAEVTASFALNPIVQMRIDALLGEAGLDSEVGQIILRRVLQRDGRNRSYINDRAASVGLMREIGSLLVEIQGQNDRLGLLDPSQHSELLDASANLQDEAANLTTLWQNWRDHLQAAQTSQQEGEALSRERDYLSHAVTELEKAQILPHEEQELSERHALLKNAAKLGDAIQATYSQLSGENGAESKLAKSLKNLDRVVQKTAHSSAIEPMVEACRQGLEQAYNLVGESLSSLQMINDELSEGVAHLSELEERLYFLRDLGRKYGVPPDELPSTLATMQASLTKIGQNHESQHQLAQRTAVAKQAWQQAALSLASKRQQAAQSLAARVNQELPSLKLPHAEFRVNCIDLDPEQWNSQGSQRIGFVASMNPGAPHGPIEKIASGGELSRLLLALKVVLAAEASAATIIFDEVDSGIGGATAAAVGARLTELAKSVQILCVTHSPQVAACGQTHWRVSKQPFQPSSIRPMATDDEPIEGKTLGTAWRTQIHSLSPAERAQEIARMLAGDTITNEALAAAQSLLREAASQL